ncbi:hypothetical protein Plhal304r1_c015g0054881 [Plasmopara halstedii]
MHVRVHYCKRPHILGTASATASPLIRALVAIWNFLDSFFSEVEISPLPTLISLKAKYVRSRDEI